MGTGTHGYRDIWVQGHMGTMDIGTYGYNENWDITVQWKMGYMGTGTLHTYVSLTYRNGFLLMLLLFSYKHSNYG